jgi:hypothetical protein
VSALVVLCVAIYYVYYAPTHQCPVTLSLVSLTLSDNKEAPCQLQALSFDMQEIGCVAQAAAS